jgi:hypothetical protein
MSNKATAYGILANDPIVVSDSAHEKVVAAAPTAANIFAHHIDGRANANTVETILNEPGYRQEIFAKAVEHELDIHKTNQSSTVPSGIAEIALRIGSNASFQIDSLRIYNAVQTPEVVIDLGDEANKLVEECKQNPSKGEEVKEQAYGNYSALSTTAQMDIADDIATMRHMSAQTQEFAWNIAQDAEKAYDQKGAYAQNPSVHQEMQVAQSASM